jgi:hypothetical protein
VVFDESCLRFEGLRDPVTDPAVAESNLGRAQRRPTLREHHSSNVDTVTARHPAHAAEQRGIPIMSQTQQVEHTDSISSQDLQNDAGAKKTKSRRPPSKPADGARDCGRC